MNTPNILLIDERAQRARLTLDSDKSLSPLDQNMLVEDCWELLKLVGARSSTNYRITRSVLAAYAMFAARHVDPETLPFDTPIQLLCKFRARDIAELARLYPGLSQGRAEMQTIAAEQNTHQHNDNDEGKDHPHDP